MSFINNIYQIIPFTSAINGQLQKKVSDALSQLYYSTVSFHIRRSVLSVCQFSTFYCVTV